MFWFPVPAAPDRAVALIDVERQYLGAQLTLERIVLPALIPIWFVALALVVRRLSPRATGEVNARPDDPTRNTRKN